jgi:hypothetical protein
LRYKEVVSSYTTVGGFVNENGGTISNCYSNITVTSYTRSSGFVYNNKGTVESCYSASKMETHNSAHNAFTGISTSGLNNTGTISDCYYLKDEFGSTSKEPATKLTTIEKSQFANFVFNEDSSNSLSGTWEITDGSLPELIDANLTLESKQQYNGIENNAYNWTFENIDLSYGKSSGGKYNLRTVASFDDLNTVVNGNTTSDYIVLCKDIECDEYTTPSSANYEFSGTFIGSNMTISNLYLKASNSSQKPYFGLFGKLAGGTVKDINIKAMQCVANNTSYVGVLAGAIDSSSVTNITINASNVVVQGKYFVGGLAGYVNNSNVTKIDVSTSVNASYRGTESYATVFGELNDNNTYDYTYSGIVTGILTGTSNMKLVNVSGECKSIGYFASACVGLVDTDSTLTLASVTVQTDQYIRGFYVSGGLVAENRGTIDRCSIAHSNSVQALIDSNNSTTNRNLTLFAGSTKVLGGLVGFNNGGNILYSYSKIDVRAETISTYVAGGLVGTMTNGSISNCYATGSVVCNKIIGGLVGSITTHNSICNVQESSTSNTSAIFADDKNLAGKISDGTVSIKNSIASNRWLSSDTEIISLAYQKGLLVGCVNPSDNSGNSTDSDTNSNSTYSDTSVDTVDSNIAIEEIDSRITIENCYVNTQLTQNTLTSTDDQIVGYANKNAILKAFMGEDVEIKNLAEIQNYSLGGVTANFDGTQSESNSEKHRIAEIESSDTLITFYYINNYDSNMFSMLNKNNDGTYDVADSFFEIPSKTSGTSIYPTIKSNINKQIEVSTTKDSGTN